MRRPDSEWFKSAAVIVGVLIILLLVTFVSGGNG